jgi:hypothetical protein
MIRFSYTPAFQDWRALNLHYIARQFRIILIIAALLIASFLILPFGQRAIGHDIDVWQAYRNNAGALTLPAIVALIYGTTLYSVHRRWKTAAELREEREFIFDENGLAVKAASFSSTTEWHHVKEADLAKGLVLMKTSQNQFYYFPRHLVTDWPMFQSLVTERVKVTKRFEKG